MAKAKVLRLAVLLALAACSEKSVTPPPGPTATAVVSPPVAEDAGDSEPPVMISGCGTECIFGFVIDAKTGHVMPLPASGEDYRQLQLAFRPDSQWMRATWMGGSESGTETCVLRDFVLDKGTFRSVKGEVLPGACPELGVGTGEAMGPR